MLVTEHVRNASETTTGLVLTGLGATGATVQVITQWGNMLVMFGNAVLVAGGLYLLIHKIKESRRRDRRTADAKEGD